MSTLIDERVVEMRFNNQQFEKNVHTSLSTLDKLKKSLNFDSAVNGLEKINNISKKTDLNTMSNAVDSMRLKFSALEVMATTALVNITNSAVNAGKRIVSALTIDPIKTGFQEYETQLGSIQTILANTQHEGTNLQQVNKALDELNLYADKTIYNFTEMTRNIGTFTAAGVKLQTSVDSIKGIANLAAISGSTSQQASVAMYQLSQALAAGRVSLMDWNSVVNAGMGGKVFQDALIRTSELLGTGAKRAVEMYGSFRESLTQGQWLTTEVLTETLKQFSGAYSEADLIQQGFTKAQAKEIVKMAETAESAATEVKTISQLWSTLKESAQSGWAQTWEIIVGDFEEAKDLLSAIAETVGNVINKMSQSRNELLLGGLSSGWKQLLEQGISDEAGYIEAIQEVARKNGDAFDKMVSDADNFNDALKKGLKEGVISSETLSDAIHNLNEKMSGMSAEELKSAGYTSDMVDKINKLDAGIQNGTISIDSFTKKILQPSGRENLIQSLWNSAKGLMSILTPIGEAFREIIPPITSKQLYSFTKNLENVTGKMKLSKDASSDLKRTFKGIFSVVNIISQAFLSFVKVLGVFIKPIGVLASGILEITAVFGDWLVALDKSITKSGSFEKSFSTIADLINAVIVSFFKFISVVSEKLAFPALETVSSAFEKMFGILSKVGDAFSEMRFNVSSVFATLVNLMGAASVLAIGSSFAKFVNTFKAQVKELLSFKSGIVEVLNSVKDTLKVWQTQLKAKTLQSIAIAIGILAASLLVLTLVDEDKLANALVGISALFGELFVAMSIFQKVSGPIKGATKSILTMLGLSSAVLILATSLKIIADLDIEHLATGLAGVTGLMVIMVKTMQVLDASNGIKGIKEGAMKMILFAAAVKILASACKDLADLSLGGIAKGLIGLSGVLYSVNVFLESSTFGGLSIKTASALVIFSTAIKILASAFGDFSQMKFGEIATGLTGLSGALVSVALSVEIMSRKTNLVQVGIGLLAVSAGMAMISSAFINLGQMSWSDIVKGFTALGGSLAILSTGLILMNNAGGGSKTLLAVSGALAIMAPVMISLGAISWEGIAKGLLSLAGSFAIVGVAGKMLTPVLPVIAGLSASLLLISAAIAGLGAGLTLIGVGFSSISVGLTSFISVLRIGVSSLVASIQTIISSIASLIPLLAKKIGEGVIAFIKAIGNGSKEIASTLKKILLSLIDILVECTPELVDGFLEIIEGILESLAQHGPEIIDSLFDFLIGILNGISEKMPEFIKAAVNALMSFFAGVVDAIKGVDTGVLLKGIAGVGLLALMLTSLSAVAALVPGAMVGVLGIGAIIAELTLVLAAIGGLAQIPGLQWLVNEGGNLLESVGVAIGKLIGGIVGGVMNGISGQFPEIASDLSGFMTNIQPFIQGASSINPSMLEGVQALAQTILILTAADIFNGITSWITGGSSLSKFAEELVPFGKAMRQFSEQVEGINENAVSSASIAGKTLAEMAATIPNSGGIISFFTGENDLTTFGSQLVTFGTAMRQYSNSLVGMNPDIVVSSASAGKALAELANTLPNTGGLLSIFSGDNSLSSFGSELIPFGYAMKQYSLAVAGLDSNVVINSANAAKAMAEVADNLPNTGGLLSIFSGDNSLSSFGKELSSFGGYFASYYEKISIIDPVLLGSVVTQFRNLVNLANSAMDVDSSGLTGFAQSLANIGNSGVNSFINVFNNAIPRIKVAVSSMVLGATTSLMSMQYQFMIIGGGITNNLIMGIQGKASAVKSIFSTLVSGCLTTVRNKATGFHSVGQSMITNFIAGIRSKDSTAGSAFVQTINKCITSIKNKYNSFKEAGKYLVDGFAAGIKENTYKASAKAKAMASAASEAARKELDERSPSKVGYRIGDYFGIGFVNGLSNNVEKSYKESSSMAAAARDGLNNVISKLTDFIDSDIDIQPTIRPVLDLSNVRAGANQLTAILSREQAMDINSSMKSISNTNKDVENGENSQSVGNSYSFVQNNYSPKALSRIDIYRQTKNQFSALKGLV